MEKPDAHHATPTAAVVLRLAGDAPEDVRPEPTLGQRIAFTIVMLGIAVYAMISGFQLGYWVTLGPGPGFFPFWIGVLMAGGTLVWSLSSILRPTAAASVADATPTTAATGRETTAVIETDVAGTDAGIAPATAETATRSRLATWIDRYRIWIVVGSMIAVAALLNPLGFQTTMFLFLMLHLRVLGRVRWIISLIVALAGSVGVFHLFWNALQVPLPLSMLIPLHAIGL